MPQISSRKLPEKHWQTVWQLFLRFLSSSDTQETAALVSLLLTDTEQVMLAKRCMISLLYIKGMSPIEICQQLKMSRSTIYKVVSLLDAYPDKKDLIRRKYAHIPQLKQDEDFPEWFEDTMKLLFDSRQKSRYH